MSGGVSVVQLPAHARTTMQASSLPAATRGLDTESQQWLDALSATGPKHQDAVDRLHALLTRAARFEIARRRRDLAGSQPTELEDLAPQAAADALIAIMRKQHTYRGDSRFTTWAYKFALLKAAVKVRTRAWQEREVPLEDDAWAQLADRRAAPETDAEAAELIDAINRAITEAGCTPT
jgi:RNA polymerase sigma-70 factor, ECF subfamily